MLADRLKATFLAVWLVASTLAFPALLATVLLPQQALLALAPVCTHRAAGSECALCGTLAGLLLVSHGNLNAAANRGALSIPLYSALIWNECVAVWYALGELLRALTPRRSRAPVQTEEFSCR
jgi:hypothetical protein